MMIDEFAVQRPPQFRIRRRIGAAQIIDRLDQADAEKMAPKPIHHRAAEILVLRIGDPGGELDSRIFARGDLAGRAVERLRGEELAGARLRRAELRPGVSFCIDRLGDAQDGHALVRGPLDQRSRRTRRNGNNRLACSFSSGWLWHLAQPIADAEERLGHRRDDWRFLRLALFADVDDIETDCRSSATEPEAVSTSRAISSHGRLAAHLLAEPVVERAHALDAAHVVIALLAVLEQVGPVATSSNRRIRAGRATDRSAGLACPALLSAEEGAHLVGVGSMPIASREARRRNSCVAA